METKTLLAMMIMAILASGCSPRTIDEKTPETIKIGYIGPLSGPSAVLGMDAIKAIEIAADEANAVGGIDGVPIKVVAEDDQYIPEKTLTAYNKLVQFDDARIILVATYGGVSALKGQAKKDGVVIIDPLDCNSQLAAVDENIFCLATETESIGESLAGHMADKGMKRAGVLYSTKDNFMSLVADSFKKKLVESGGSVVEENYAYTDTDFKTQLMKLNEIGPDVIVFLGHDETGLAMKQAREIGVTAQFMATGTITSPGLQESSGGAAEGTLFAYWEPSSENALAKAFEEKFAAKAGRPPILPLTTHPAYDTMKVLTEKVLPSAARFPKSEQAIAVKQALIGVNGYLGTTGEITMGIDGAVRIKETVFKLEGGKPVKAK